jgi:protein-tyrosine phosphatase
MTSDFNLLLLEVVDTNIEKQFFKQNPNLGSFYHYPIVGDLLAPDSVSSSIRKSMASSLPKWQVDNLPKAMDTLHQLLNTQYEVPTVIYIHCEAGMDRTGEVSGSYYMRYLNWPFQYALSYDNTCIENRNISNFSRNSFQWYCYYLQISQHQNQDCTLPAAFLPVNCATGVRAQKNGKKH